MLTIHWERPVFNTFALINCSNLFFQVISSRYKKNSTLITANRVFTDWGKVLYNTTIATAIADRIVENSEIFIIEGRSYRLKRKKDSFQIDIKEQKKEKQPKKLTKAQKLQTQMDDINTKLEMLSEGIVFSAKKKEEPRISQVTRRKVEQKKPRKKKVDPKKDFELLSQKHKDKKTMPYSMSGTFKKDDVIDHHTFGRGFVIDILSQKMEVVFSDRPRILVFNR